MIAMDLYQVESEIRKRHPYLDAQCTENAGSQTLTISQDNKKIAGVYYQHEYNKSGACTLQIGAKKRSLTSVEKAMDAIVALLEGQSENGTWNLLYLMGKIKAQYRHLKVTHSESPIGEALFVKKGKELLATINYRYESSDCSLLIGDNTHSYDSVDTIMNALNPILGKKNNQKQSFWNLFGR
jgi:hypothetical protein